MGLADMVICHGTRCGRSAAIKPLRPGLPAANLLLTVDAARFSSRLPLRGSRRIQRSALAARVATLRSATSATRMDRTAKRRVPDVDQCRAIHP